MSDKRRDKRWNREHRKKNGNGNGSSNGESSKVSPENVRLVYRPKSDAEAKRRVARAKSLVGTPFVPLPGITDHSTIVFHTKDGTPVPAEAVEMVFNDMLLCDAVSNWGKDGPLYSDDIDERPGNASTVYREVYEYALKAYAGVEIPKQLRRPTQ